MDYHTKRAQMDARLDRQTAQHTPSAWAVSETHTKGQLSGLAVHPCHFYFEGKVNDTARANAALIAAAPDLLREIQAAQKILRQNKEFIGSMMDKQFTAVINKATGK